MRDDSKASGAQADMLRGTAQGAGMVAAVLVVLAGLALAATPLLTALRDAASWLAPAATSWVPPLAALAAASVTLFAFWPIGFSDTWGSLPAAEDIGAIPWRDSSALSLGAGMSVFLATARLMPTDPGASLAFGLFLAVAFAALAAWDGNRCGTVSKGSMENRIEALRIEASLARRPKGRRAAA